MSRKYVKEMLRNQYKNRIKTPSSQPSNDEDDLPLSEIIRKREEEKNDIRDLSPKASSDEPPRETIEETSTNVSNFLNAIDGTSEPLPKEKPSSDLTPPPRQVSETSSGQKSSSSKKSVDEQIKQLDDDRYSDSEHSRSDYSDSDSESEHSHSDYSDSEYSHSDDDRYHSDRRRRSSSDEDSSSDSYEESSEDEDRYRSKYSSDRDRNRDSSRESYDRKNERRDERRDDRRTERRDDRRTERRDDRRTERKDERRDDRVTERKNERRTERKDERKDERVTERKDERRTERKEERKDERRDERRTERRDERKDERKDTPRVPQEARVENRDDRRSKDTGDRRKGKMSRIRERSVERRYVVDNHFKNISEKSLLKMLKREDVSRINSTIYGAILDVMYKFTEAVVRELAEEIKVITSSDIEIIMERYVEDDEKELPEEGLIATTDFEQSIVKIVSDSKVGIKKSALFVFQLYIECIIGKIIRGAKLVAEACKRQRTGGEDIYTAFQIYML